MHLPSRRNHSAARRQFQPFHSEGRRNRLRFEEERKHSLQQSHRRAQSGAIGQPFPHQPAFHHQKKTQLRSEVLSLLRFVLSGPRQTHRHFVLIPHGL